MITVDGSGLHVTREAVVRFFESHAGDASLLAATEDMLEAYCRALQREQAPEPVAAVASEVRGHLQALAKQQAEAAATLAAQARGEVQGASAQLLGLLSVVKEAVQGSLGKIGPDAVAAATQEGAGKALAAQSARLEQHLAAIDKAIADSKAALSSTNQHLLGRLERLSEQVLVAQTKSDVSLRAKGQEAERRFQELLEEALAPVGIELSSVAGHAGCTDFVARKLAHPDISIELKAHKHRVDSRNVERFESDLARLNRHGVIVALHSGFVGKENLQVDQLPSGKFAVYLARNEFDVDVVREVVCLLYRLDKITSQAEAPLDGEAVIRLSSQTMQKVGQHITDCAAKIKQLRKHLRDGLQLLNELSLDAIERLLLGEMEAPTVAPAFACPACGHRCHNAGGLARHMKAKHPDHTQGCMGASG